VRRFIGVDYVVSDLTLTESIYTVTIDDVTTYPLITKELGRKRIQEEDIVKILEAIS
jgi:hypothetical protein